MLVEAFNEHLRHDGYRLVPVSEISGRPVYAARSSLSAPPALLEMQASDVIGDQDHLSRQITRMVSSVDSDPDGRWPSRVETHQAAPLVASSW